MRRKIETERIWEAALGVFARYGYKRTRVEDIAGELGLSAGTLYNYAENKEDLYEHAVAYGIARWQKSVLDAVAAQPDVVARFKTMCLAGYDYLADDAELRKLLTEDPSIFPLAPRKQRFPEIDAASIRLIESIVADGVKQGLFQKDVDPQHAGELLYSIYVMFIIKAYVKSEGRSAREMFVEGIELILSGLLRRDN